MVLMTDGANTRSPDYGARTHSGGDVALANIRTAELCSNIKGKDIKIFTVAFDVSDATIKDILRSCATSPSHFFEEIMLPNLRPPLRTLVLRFRLFRISR